MPLADVGAIAFCRMAVNPLENVVRVSQALTWSDELTVARQVAGKDEIAQLLNALSTKPLNLSRVASNVHNIAHGVATLSQTIDSLNMLF